MLGQKKLSNTGVRKKEKFFEHKYYSVIIFSLQGLWSAINLNWNIYRQVSVYARLVLQQGWMLVRRHIRYLGFSTHNSD